MNRMRAFAETLSGFCDAVGRLASWCFLALAAVILFDVVTRRFLVLGSTRLQELEWHIHTLLFCLCLAYGYVRDCHVRVDLVRSALGPRTRAIIELAGIVLLLLPFLGIVTYYSISFAFRAFVEGEVSAAGTGLSHRWIVKSFIPAGLVLLFLAAIARGLDSLRELTLGAESDRSSPRGGDTPERIES